MKIGELAQRTGCKAETIRYYEAEGLLPEPGRTEANYRDYGQAHLERLGFIRNCRGLDMGHDEIKALLRYLDSPQADCGGVNELLAEHLTHVRSRMAELVSLEAQLLALQERCRTANRAEDCGILQGLGGTGKASTKDHSHLKSSKDVHRG